MSVLSSPRFLAIYSGILTLVFAVTVLCGLAAMRNAKFGIITARRINIVEPDGTVRLTISNRADFPGGWIHKKESPRPDRTDAAGMLFMSEEGTEQGGLIWGASQLPDGTIENHGHLSLDQYEENQIFALDAGQEGKDKFSRITIADQGDYPVEEKRKAEDRIGKLPGDKQDAAWEEFFATHRHDVKRLELGRAPDGSVGLSLRDGNGKVRIVLDVQSDGKGVLQFLDDRGKVVSEFTGQKK
ncbi:MAG TPA: hypothetical protein VE377_01690 [Candidatus Dormibacteraeota bacterium]|nr:hypothetical protein [Candidatus Dormibacteraeota bacterium]